jgi:CRP/FNR family transcriptional regulator
MDITHASQNTVTKHTSGFKVSVLQTSCRNCSLASLCLPKDLIGAEVKELETIVTQLPPVSKHGQIYNQGENFTSLYVVRSGCVKKFQIDSEGNEQVIGFSLPGELLGIDAIGSGKYMSSAEALDTTSFCQLKYSKFEELCGSIPGLTKHILKMAGQELIAEHDIHKAISQKSIDERVAVFFTSLATRLKILGYSSTEFNLPMSRHDIANFLGMQPETFSRSLKKLIQENLIDVNLRNIKIKDQEHLRQLAGHCEACPTNKVMHG